ncbi:outer membrane beta-barrel protein [Pseudoalteromonas sp.]|uniref:outer membrane beta-barrel protein n=1 Tax=Pseudoalteromonas sp. TaxID=53249 RepID=UPI0035624C14
MKKSILTCAIATLLSFNVQANNEPGAIRTESGFIVTPLLDLGLKHDDNIYSRSSDETSSAIFTVDPSVNFLLDDGVNSYTIDVGILSGFYSEDSTDNFVDGFLGLGGHFEPSSKSRFDINLDANWTTEQRGTGLTEGTGNTVDKPIRYAEQTLSGEYEYGSKSAFGRLAVMAEYYNKDYLNYKEQTQYRNLEHVMLGGKFIYNTQSGSDAFVELKNTAVNYDVTNPNELSRDSNDINASVGIEWEATALTSGSAKIGYEEKEFDDSGRAKHSGISWEVGVTWQPLTYSSLDFTTSKSADETLTEGDFIDATTLGVAWTHDWNDRVSSQLAVDYSDEKYVGINRDDSELTLTAAIDYQMLRWVGFNFYIEIVDKDSTNDNIYFDKNVVGVNTRLSL